MIPSLTTTPPRSKAAKNPYAYAKPSPNFQTSGTGDQATVIRTDN
jgi:hypothetical protein